MGFASGRLRESRGASHAPPRSSWARGADIPVCPAPMLAAYSKERTQTKTNGSAQRPDSALFGAGLRPRRAVRPQVSRNGPGARHSVRRGSPTPPGSPTAGLPERAWRPPLGETFGRIPVRSSETGAQPRVGVHPDLARKDRDIDDRRKRPLPRSRANVFLSSISLSNRLQNRSFGHPERAPQILRSGR
jgi:hypothetical protein